MAGCVHAIAGAPADNVRLILEGGYRTQIQTAQSVTGWREAWKEVFREVQHVEPVRDSIGRAAGVQIGGPRTRKEAREFRAWMKEIKGMSRGWEGLGWGCGKDMFGFAIFFAVFDATRQIASSVVRFFDPTITDYNAEVTQSKNNAARIGQSVVLVTGGVAAGFGYEFAARPFDNARRIVYEHRMELPKDTGSLSKVALPMKSATAKSHILLTHLKENGFASLFRLPGTVVQEDQATHFRRTKMFLRVLGRLGPWGVGFLMWEGMGYR
ncbi:hypothetical protein FRC03_010312 [Tulasnella sp. 419]|nr:hypothetical protein FRC03_010312 [Tulasnella sp. 419]